MTKHSTTGYTIALIAALGLFMPILDTTIVNVGLVPMAKAFNTDLNTINWVLTGYLLAQGAVIPMAGYLGNRLGLRRVFIMSLVLFTLGSFLCALAPSEAWLIGFRVFQGIGAGALFPLAQSLAFGSFPPEKRAAATPFIGVPILFAPAFGPTIGGLILDNWGWQYMFYINVPVGLLAIFLAFWLLPADQAPEQTEVKNRFDFMGLAFSMLGILALVYAVTLVSETKPDSQTALNPQGDLNGWGYWLVWALIGAGVVLLAVFTWYELRISKDPVPDLGLFKDYNFSVSSIVIWFATIVLFSSLLLVPVFLQQVHLPHLSAVDTGLALMPQGLAAIVGVAIGSRLYDKVGVRVLVLAGVLILLGSSWPLMNFTTDTDGPALLPWLLLRGLSFGFIALPVQTLALQRITGPALTKATSLFTIIRQVAQSVGNAIIISLFAQQTTQHVATLRDQALQNLPKGLTLNPNNPQLAALKDQLIAKAGTASVNDVFTLLTWATALMLLLALMLPSLRKQTAGLDTEKAGVNLEASLMG